MSENTSNPEDFDINGLMDPTGQTNADFELACSRVDTIGDIKTSDNRIIHFVDQQFADGSRLVGHSVSGSEEYMEAWGETEPTRSILLKGPNGTEYDYSAYTTGVRKLFIKRLGDRVTPETPDVIGVLQEAGIGTVALQGTPEFIGPMLADMKEASEADRLGVSRLTDSSLAELTDAIQTAIESGPVATELK